MKVTLLIPTLNEISGLQEVMPRLKPEWYDQLIVVDGGSTDGTIEYLKEKGYFVVSQKRKGMRWAYLESLPFVQGDIIITFSPDGNSVAEVIPQLAVRMREGYDMVIVSRYREAARSEDDTWLTALANKVFTFTINLLFGGHYTDAMVIYRAYKKELVGLLELDKDIFYRLGEKLVGKPMSWEPLMSIRCAKRRLKVAEIPGDEPPRIRGARRVQWRWGFAYILQILQEVFIWR